jgi:excisionase family DNA binding protein
MEATEQKAYISVKEFLEALGGRLSKNTVYQAIADGAIPSVRISKRILVPADALDRMLEAQADWKRILPIGRGNVNRETSSQSTPQPSGGIYDMFPSQ